MFQTKWTGRIIIIAWSIIFFSTCFVGCSRGLDGNGPKVLVIGVEGISWAALESYERKAELIAFQKFKEDGAWGVLESVDPVVGAAIWASLATGMTQTDHGIVRGLTADSDKGLIISNKFECLPLWEILGESGIDSAQVGWPGSHKSSGTPLRVSETDVYSPLGIFGNSGTLVWNDSYDKDALGKWFVDKPGDESLLSARIARNALENVVRFTLSEIKMGTDVIMAYFDGPLSARHHDGVAKLLDVAEPELPRPALTIDYLRELNIAIESLLDAVGNDAYVFLVSDSAVPPVEFQGTLKGTMHPIHGIFAVLGPNAVMGKQLENPTVLDLVPTILAIRDLPVAVDMPGRVVQEIFEHPLDLPDRIITYENLSRTDYSVGGVALSIQDMGRLKKLAKYLDNDLSRWKTHRNEYAYELALMGKTAGARNELDLDARRNAYNPMTLYPRALLLEGDGFNEVALENLDDAMNVLMDFEGDNPEERVLIGAVGAAAVRIRLLRNDYAKAGENLEWAAARAPDEEPWDLWRVRLSMAKGENAQARLRLKSFIDRKGLSPEAALLRADIELTNNKKDEARKTLSEALMSNPKHSGLLTKLGFIAHANRDFQEAVSYYQKAAATGKTGVDDMYIYASALNSLSKTDEALGVLEEIIRNRPLDRRAWTALRQIKAGGSDADGMIDSTYQGVLAEHFAFELLTGD